jgi:hypothetical protein
MTKNIAFKDVNQGTALGTGTLPLASHDSSLQFGSLNHGQYDTINSELACPKLPANRTKGGHRGIDANDHLQPQTVTLGKFGGRAA